ncbi:MAG: hypothetical protein QXG86_00980 [Candidatus Woesearchaeota archaeon]
MIELIKKLEACKEFKEYCRDNKDIFLAHFFYMDDEPNKDIVQIGYYNKKTEMIVTFMVEKDKVTKNPEEKVFKEQQEVIMPLEMSKVKIDVEQAFEIADNFQKKKYPEQKPVKRVAILQHLPLGQVWNITYISNSFNTLNIKIDSEKKKIISDKLISLLGKTIS